MQILPIMVRTMIVEVTGFKPEDSFFFFYFFYFAKLFSFFFFPSFFFIVYYNNINKNRPKFSVISRLFDGKKSSKMSKTFDFSSE